MLTSFINLNAKYSSKRNGKRHNLNVPIPRIQSPPSPASFISPAVVDINDNVFSRVGSSYSPLAQDEEWYGSYDSKYEDENTLPRTTLLDSSRSKLEVHSEPLTDWFIHDPPKLGIRETMEGSYERLKGSGSGGARNNRNRKADVFSWEEAVNQTAEVTLTEML